MRIINTCKDCPNRYIGCHADCETYIQAEQEWQKRKDFIRKAKREAYGYYTFKRDMVHRSLHVKD